MTRLEQLEQYFKDEPHDPFNLYALALEYRKSDAKQSLHLFNQLLTNHPDYLALYFPLGELYYEQGESEKAIMILEQGITVAMQQNNQKALKELKGLLQNIAFE